MIPTLNTEKTDHLLNWVHSIQSKAAEEFEATQRLVTRLGAHHNDNSAEIGFWTPELTEQTENWFLEVLRPAPNLNLLADEQTVDFTVYHVPLVQDGEFVWGVVDNMIAGTRDTVGDFYWIRYQDSDGTWRVIHDHLAYSVPFGTHAPAEYYNMEKLQAERTDKAHFTDHMQWDDTPEHQHPDGIPRVKPAVNILQIHPGTASKMGTIEGLRQIYATIAEKRRNDEPLTPAEQNFIGYDALQLMPIEPPIEHEDGRLFWNATADYDPTADTMTVTVHQHDIFDWGYDVMLSASPAVNPAILSSKRPDELVDFIAELHNFPDGAIQFMTDIVYGHTDNQAIDLFHSRYLAGANMYGQNLNYLDNITRATWLEMQRRKHQFGVDGVRVDGAQDFKSYHAETDTLYHDDDYLRQMNDMVQHVAGRQYRPWMIFEDGRPWPREDWELASTYREITKQMPNVWQWGPLTFAHNTPFIFTFWVSKMWRVREITEVGKYWITGCANHDTLRRGTQVDIQARINSRLGDTLPEIFQNAYDNPAARLLDYCMMPGIPMDFTNALMRAPWGFIRNTDDKYGVKVVSEESNVLYWVMWPERWEKPDVFPRLKSFGLEDLQDARRFFDTLNFVQQATDYDIAATAAMMNASQPPLAVTELDVPKLKAIAHAWMADMFDYCNVEQYADELDPARTQFNLDMREFRRTRPWLVENLREDEFFDYRHPSNGTILYYGLRQSDDEMVLFIANMEGEPVTVLPTDLPIPNLPTEGWELALQAPNVYFAGAQQPLTLDDSQAVVLLRRK